MPIVCDNCFSQQHDSPECPYTGTPKKGTTKVLKIFVEKIRTVRLGTDINANDFAHFHMLVEEAKYDFPGLKDEEIRIDKHLGTSYCGTYVIEFSSSDAPPAYERI